MSLYESIFKITNACSGLATRENAGGYPYIPLSEMLRVLKPVLQAENVVLMQLPSVQNRMVFVKTILSKGTEQLEHICSLPMVDPSPVSAGCLITYARRYTLAGIFGFNAEDADESALPVSSAPAASDTEAQADEEEKIIPLMDEVLQAISVAELVQLATLEQRIPAMFTGEDAALIKEAIAQRRIALEA